jgi:phosphopentomutase
MAFSEKEDAAQLQHLFTAWGQVTKIESVKDIFNNSGHQKRIKMQSKSILLRLWNFRKMNIEEAKRIY